MIDDLRRIGLAGLSAGGPLGAGAVREEEPMDAAGVTRLWTPSPVGAASAAAAASCATYAWAAGTSVPVPTPPTLLGGEGGAGAAEEAGTAI